MVLTYVSRSAGLGLLAIFSYLSSPACISCDPNFWKTKHLRDSYWITGKYPSGIFAVLLGIYQPLGIRRYWSLFISYVIKLVSWESINNYLLWISYAFPFDRFPRICQMLYRMTSSLLRASGNNPTGLLFLENESIKRDQVIKDLLVPYVWHLFFSFLWCLHLLSYNLWCQTEGSSGCFYLFVTAQPLRKRNKSKDLSCLSWGNLLITAVFFMSLAFSPRENYNKN